MNFFVNIPVEPGKNCISFKELMSLDRVKHLSIVKDFRTYVYTVEDYATVEIYDKGVLEHKKSFLYCYEAVEYLLGLNIYNFDLQYHLFDVEWGVYLLEVNHQSPYAIVFENSCCSMDTADTVMEQVYSRYKRTADTFTLIKHYGALEDKLFLNREYLPLKGELVEICKDEGFSPSDEAWQYRFRLNDFTWSWLRQRRSVFSFFLLEDFALWQKTACLYATITHEQMVSFCAENEKE